MQKKKSAGTSTWIDPDDAPELTNEFFNNAEVFHGDTFIRRGPGRPRMAAAKEQISVRLDPDVLAKLREAGPGWQSQINAVLRQALGLGSVDQAQLPHLIRDVYATLKDVADDNRTLDAPVENPPITPKKSSRRSSGKTV